MNSKGQVTIPAELRQRYGLHPGDEFEVVEADEGFEIRRHPGTKTRGERAVDRLRGTATTDLSTEELMKLLRE